MLAHSHITDEPLSAYTAALHRVLPAARAITASCYSLATELPTGSDGNIQLLPEELSVSTVNELIEFVYVTHHDDAAWAVLSISR